MSHTSRLVRRALVGAAVLSIALVPQAASAQGKAKAKGGNAAQHDGHGNGNGSGNGGGAKRVPPGQAKKYSQAEAVDFSRQVLVANGYQVQRVEVVGNTRVIYYYRGNNGRGRGRGPLERMVVRPSADRYVFESAHQDLVAAIKRKMGW